MAYRVLIADDDELMCGYLKRALSKGPWEIEVVHDGQAALEALCQGRYDVAVIDVCMPEYNGLEVLQMASQQGVQTDVVLLTGRGSIELAVDAMKAGAREFFTKPLQPREAVHTVRRLIAARQPTPHMRARRLDAYVRENATDPELDLQSLCRQFRISQRYVCRLFKEELGLPFRCLLRRYRVERARNFLAETDLAMFQIAELCGFRNQKRFAEAFRREEGVTPKRYRERS